jgi:hypothetical protein
MRAFIVGNGPSLAKTNLDLLVGEVSFATNRIQLIYDRTDWRPSYYVRAEGMELHNEPDPAIWMGDFEAHLDIPIFANLYFRNRLGYTPENWTTIKSCAHYDVNYDDVRCPHLWHLPVLCTFGSSVNVAIQLAVQMGYGPIYLVGCDLGYKDGEASHFAKEYEAGYEKMLRPARYANYNTLVAHMIAKRSSPVPIYNASFGGELEVYERVRLEDVKENASKT